MMSLQSRTWPLAITGMPFPKLNLRVYKQDRIAIIGPNGVGKSTLLKTIVKKKKPLQVQSDTERTFNLAIMTRNRQRLSAPVPSSGNMG